MAGIHVLFGIELGLPEFKGTVGGGMHSIQCHPSPHVISCVFATVCAACLYVVCFCFLLFLVWRQLYVQRLILSQSF